MTTYLVRHTTTYRYRQPVGFGEHRVMAKPRADSDQALLDFELRSTPEASSRRWTRDVFGNAVCLLRFSGRADTLSFESTARVRQVLPPPGFDIDAAGRTVPVTFAPGELPDLAPYLAPAYPDPDDAIAAWARSFLRTEHGGRRPGDATPTLELLAAMTEAIRHRFTYVRRVEKGVQSPSETLALGSGTCRDFTVLMMEAVRALGLPARFVSGYLHVRSRDEGRATESRAGQVRGGGSTHAWAQVYLPGAGWIDFDPTNATVGAAGLIRVAVAREPGQAIPLWGSFTGFAADDLGMSVSVDVTREEPDAQADLFASAGSPVRSQRRA